MMMRSVFEKLNLPVISIDLGVVELATILTNNQKKELDLNLNNLGFELIEDTKLLKVEKIKNLIVDLVQNESNQLKIKLSAYLSGILFQDYNSISSLFSEVENKTIEQYYIQLKIERVKELLTYNELNLNEIAYQLNYSSVAYLSNQFKKVTGITPSDFKLSKNVKRLQINEV
jgi:AraC-like DNA-binding protein